ncbi:hypothetical protein [Streptomyces sp. NPDC048196]|uniref:hypothetical protein n=1 Tax=Streptomyces sp. NPDC048196 TaxID=3154712 RepID=UPI0033D386E2
MSLTETLLIVAFWAGVALAVAVRLGAAIRRHQAAIVVPPYATFTPPPPGARWLMCDTTTCARLQTIHTPQPGGAYRCTTCGHTKGD